MVRAHKKELEDIEIKHHVEIPRKADGKKLSLKPKVSCTTEDYEQACNQFISLYQNTYLQVRMQRFSLKLETNIVSTRMTISKMSKQFPVLVEIETNTKSKLWRLFGEANNIEEALRFLEEEGVEIIREREYEKGRRKKAKDVEDYIEVAPPEISTRGIELIINSLIYLCGYFHVCKQIGNYLFLFSSLYSFQCIEARYGRKFVLILLLYF